MLNTLFLLNIFVSLVIGAPGWQTEWVAPKTIADLAISTPSLSTLLAAVKAADLVDTLAGDGPLTVFAPTNEGL